MMQGDAYKLQVKITLNGGDIDATMVDDVEICIGYLQKTMSSGEITYDDNSKSFLFPLTQEESFRLHPGQQPAQIRIKTKSGDVIGTIIPNIHLRDAMSEEVL